MNKDNIALLNPSSWLLVIGMHRSGTSAITGVLGKLGLGLPLEEDMMLGGNDNPIHNESNCLTRFNDDLLRFLGDIWHVPTLKPKGWENSPALAPWYERAQKLAENTFAHVKGVIAWKDPRNCLLLPFWQKIFGSKMAILFIWRNPIEVALSLQTRDKFALPYGLILWENYVLEALAGIKGMQVLVLNYNDFLEHREKNVTLLVNWLRQVFPSYQRPTTDQVQNAIEVLQIKHCHHHAEKKVQLSKKQTKLISVLRSMAGFHQSFPEINFFKMRAHQYFFVRWSKNFLIKLQRRILFLKTHLKSLC